MRSDTIAPSAVGDSCLSDFMLVTYVLLYLSVSGPPTLTLWVGLASGYVAAYIVNTVNKAAKRFELVPTRECRVKNGNLPTLS